MPNTEPANSFDVFEAETGDTVEFILSVEFPGKRYLGKLKSVTHNFLSVFHIIPAPGFEDRFPARDPKLVVVTDTFIVDLIKPDKTN